MLLQLLCESLGVRVQFGQCHAPALRPCNGRACSVAGCSGAHGGESRLGLPCRGPEGTLGNGNRGRAVSNASHSLLGCPLRRRVLGTRLTLGPLHRRSRGNRHIIQKEAIGNIVAVVLVALQLQLQGALSSLSVRLPAAPPRLHHQIRILRGERDAGARASWPGGQGMGRSDTKVAERQGAQVRLGKHAEACDAAIDASDLALEAREGRACFLVANGDGELALLAVPRGFPGILEAGRGGGRVPSCGISEVGREIRTIGVGCCLQVLVVNAAGIEFCLVFETNVLKVADVGENAPFVGADGAERRRLGRLGRRHAGRRARAGLGKLMDGPLVEHHCCPTRMLWQLASWKCGRPRGACLSLLPWCWRIAVWWCWQRGSPASGPRRVRSRQDAGWCASGVLFDAAANVAGRVLARKRLMG